MNERNHDNRRNNKRDMRMKQRCMKEKTYNRKEKAPGVLRFISESFRMSTRMASVLTSREIS
jgi:hypothetical protein